MRAGYPSTSHVSGTGAGFNLMTSAPGWAYLVVTLAGTDAPPPPRVVDGAWDGVVAKAMLALGAADTVAGVTVAGLTQETDYTVYFVLEDINGVLTADTVAMSLTTPRVAPRTFHRSVARGCADSRCLAQRSPACSRLLSHMCLPAFSVAPRLPTRRQRH